MLDKRYKVNEEIVLAIINLRAQGHTMQSLADKFNISIATFCYWASADHRKKQREKNKKRMCSTEKDKAKASERARIRYHNKSKHEHMRDRVKRTIRENNFRVYGKKRSYWLEKFPHYFENRPLAKLDGVL